MVFSGFDSSAKEQRQKKIFSDTTEKSREQDWFFFFVFCLHTCRSVGLLLQTFIHWVNLIQVYVNISVKEEYQGFVGIKTNRESASTPSWAVPCCGTHLQLWSWCCSPKVSSRELLWQCACRRSTRVSLPLIFRTRSWRWILMMTCRELPARESRARARHCALVSQFIHARMERSLQRLVQVRVRCACVSEPTTWFSERNEWCMLRCLLQKKKNIPGFLWTFLYVTWMAGYPTRMTHHQRRRRAREERGWWVRGLEVGKSITGGSLEEGPSHPAENNMQMKQLMRKLRLQLWLFHHNRLFVSFLAKGYWVGIFFLHF